MDAANLGNNVWHALNELAKDNGNPLSARIVDPANSNNILSDLLNQTEKNKIKTDKNYAKKFSGKIMLQVESRGEAYYIDSNGNIHYLKDGSAAYTAMRNLGLGIKNSDLNKIPEGKL
jgi:hypothetical protein